MLDDTVIISSEQRLADQVTNKDIMDILDSVEEPKEEKPSWPLDDQILQVHASVEDKIKQLVFVPRDKSRGQMRNRESEITNRSLGAFFFLKLLSKPDYDTFKTLEFFAAAVKNARKKHDAARHSLPTTTRHVPTFTGQAIPGSILRMMNEGSVLSEQYLRALIKQGGKLQKTFDGIHKKMRDPKWQKRYSLATDPNWQPRYSTKKFKPHIPKKLELREGYGAT